MMQTRTLFNRRACYVSIAGAFIFLLIVGVVRFLASEPVRPDPSRITERTETPPRRVQRTPPVFNSETYYQTIIDNNLFRPLGWRPPVPREPYRLLGTVLATDADTPAEAIIQTTTGEKIYIVSTGEPLDAETEVVSIESKSVRLSTNGKQRTLKLPSGF